MTDNADDDTDDDMYALGLNEAVDSLIYGGRWQPLALQPTSSRGEFVIDVWLLAKRQ